MEEGKIREKKPRTIKTLDRAVNAGERMKQTVVQLKEKSEHSLYAPEETPEAYAGEQLSEKGSAGIQKAVRRLEQHGRRAARGPKRNQFQAKKENSQFSAGNSTGRENSALAGQERTVSNRPDCPNRISVSRQTGKQDNQEGKKKQGEHRTAQSVPRSKRAPLPVENPPLPERPGIKEKKIGVSDRIENRLAGIKQRKGAAAVKEPMFSAVPPASPALPAQMAGRRRAVWLTNKARSVQGAGRFRRAARAAGNSVKGILAAGRTVTMALAAGGSVILMVFVLICMVGMLIASPFGIFFSGEDSGSGQTMQTVVREINQEYEEKLAGIRSGTVYDSLETTGARAVWPEVLAVYAVKTSLNPEASMEVATMDEAKKAILRDIFWQMNSIASRTETKTETVVTETDDGHGNILQTESQVTRTTLYITVSHKTAEEMAEQFLFSEEQKEQLTLLLAGENQSMWNQVLYGIGSGDGEIVSVALSQVGNVGGEIYWRWYGFGSKVNWCACFVSWCADQCGYIDAGVIPKFAACVDGAAWFQERELWQNRSYVPRAGDIIFFDKQHVGETHHVGIVERVEDGVIYTVEGNSSDQCRQRNYPVGSDKIYGFGVPAY